MFTRQELQAILLSVEDRLSNLERYMTLAMERHLDGLYQTAVETHEELWDLKRKIIKTILDQKGD